MAASFRVIQDSAVMFGKKKQGVFFTELVQAGKVKYPGTALVLGGLVILAAVSEGGGETLYRLSMCLSTSEKASSPVLRVSTSSFIIQLSTSDSFKVGLLSSALCS